MAGKKRTHELIDIHCILCKQECNERSNTTKEQWLNLQSKAEKWQGLDKFGTVFRSVSWDNGPKDMYFHTGCKINISSQRKLEQSLKRKDKTSSINQELGINVIWC